jgi:hypothetical protein
MDKEKEYTTKQILINNKYDIKILDKTIQTITANPSTQHNNSPTTITQPRTKWATFTYVGPQIKFITKLFKHTNVNVAFKTNNTLGHILTHNTYNNTNHFNCITMHFYSIIINHQQMHLRIIKKHS